MFLKFDQLNEENQAKAVKHFANQLLEVVAMGHVRFNDKLNGDDLQARIDKAIAKAEKMHTPWFAHEYIQDDAKAMASLRGMAQCDAEDTMYRIENGRLEMVQYRQVEVG